MGGRKAKVENCGLGKQVAWETSESMWNSGKGWEKAVHMPSCVTYLTQEHMVFVEWTLTYLAMGVV